MLYFVKKKLMFQIQFMLPKFKAYLLISSRISLQLSIELATSIQNCIHVTLAYSTT